MNETTQEDLIYLRTRAAHLLTGINRALELLNQERAELVLVLEGGHKKLGRPPNIAAIAGEIKEKKAHKYWDSRTPEERSAEMHRRNKVRLAKKAAAAQGVKFEPKEFKVEIPIEPEVVKKKGHPHPRKGKPSKWWASLSPEQRKAHAAKARKAMMKKLGYGKKKQLVNGHAKTEAQAAA